MHIQNGSCDLQSVFCFRWSSVVWTGTYAWARAILGSNPSGPTNPNLSIFFYNKLILNVEGCWDAAADKSLPGLDKKLEQLLKPIQAI